MTEQSQEQKTTQTTTEGLREAVTDVAKESASAIRQVGHSTAETMKKPTTTAAIAGAVVMAAAVTFGVLETALGGAAAYGVYRVMRRRREAAAH